MCTLLPQKDVEAPGDMRQPRSQATFLEYHGNGHHRTASINTVNAGLGITDDRPLTGGSGSFGGPTGHGLSPALGYNARCGAQSCP